MKNDLYTFVLLNLELKPLHFLIHLIIVVMNLDLNYLLIFFLICEVSLLLNDEFFGTIFKFKFFF
jgi:hypothetical protein